MTEAVTADQVCGFSFVCFVLTILQTPSVTESSESNNTLQTPADTQDSVMTEVSEEKQEKAETIASEEPAVQQWVITILETILIN